MAQKGGVFEIFGPPKKRKKPDSIALMDVDEMPDTSVIGDMTRLTSSSLSTAEQERRADRKKRQERGTACRSAGTIMPVGAVSEAVPTEPPPSSLNVYSMEDLLHMHPNMKLKKRRLHTSDDRDHIHDPINDAILHHVNSICMPVFEVSKDQTPREKVVEQLRTRKKRVPLMKASIESAQLMEAGRFPVCPGGPLRNFPACCNGNKCVAKRVVLPAGPNDGFVLMAFMFEDEYNSFLKDGAAPLEPRPCILCIRAQVTSYILDLRPNFKRVQKVDGGFVCHPYRNLVDEKEGYHAVDMIQPSQVRWEGLVDSVVAFNIRKLRAFRDDSCGGRWVVDQSPSVWSPPPIANPCIGDTVLLFRKRVERQVAPGKYGTLASKCQIAASVKLQMDLPGMVLRASKQPTLQQRWAEAVLRLDHAFLSMDKRTSHLRKNKRFTEWDPRNTGLQEYVLRPWARYYSVLHQPPGINTLHECSYWYDNRGIKDHLVHVLSKVAPHRCQTRRFGPVLAEIFGVDEAHAVVFKKCVSQRKAEAGSENDTDMDVDAEDPEFYPGAELRKAQIVFETGTARDIKKTKKWLAEPAQAEGWDPEQTIRNVMKWAHLLLKKTRKEGCGVDPVYRENVQIVRQWILLSLTGMLPVCEYRPPIAVIQDIVTHLVAHGTALLDQALFSANYICIFAIREYMCYIVESSPVTLWTMKALFKYDEFANITRDTMNRIRKIVFCRAKSAVSFCAMLTNPDLATLCKLRHSRILRSGHQRQRQPLMEILHTCNRGSKGPFVVNTRNQEGLDIEGHPVSELSVEWLPLEKVRLMERWFEALDPDQHSLIKDVWPHLHKLGASKKALEKMYNIVHEHDKERMGKRKLTSMQETFRTQHPRDFYLMQTMCSMWIQRDFPRVHELPSHYRNNQLQALRERFELPADAPVPIHRVLLHYCRVCKRIYSLARCAGKDAFVHNRYRRLIQAHCGHPLAKTDKQIMNKHMWESEGFGFREVQRDFEGNFYCPKDSHNGYRKCGDDPLVELPLLGRVAEFRKGACFTLCPQQGCGLAMEIDTQRCVTTERGIACHVCTSKIHAARFIKALRRFSVDGSQSFRCSVCNAPCQPRRTFMYPFGITLCGIHNSSRLVSDLKRGATTCTKENIIKRILGSVKKYKKEKFEMNSGNRTRAYRNSRRACRTKHRNPVHMRT